MKDRWVQEARERHAALSWITKLLLDLGLEIPLRDENLVPDNPDNPPERLYLFYCRKADTPNGKTHGPQIDYRHGYERTVRCRTCESALAASLAPQPELVHLQV